FTPVEARDWLGIEIASARCYRPERLVITEGGEFIVKAERFRGAFAEAELCAPGGGATRLFFHRSGGAAFTSGMNVTMKVDLP
ncbi:MAG: hypothetical protein WCF18_06730, partial [Chthoniobacteraceae bacterium]